MSRPPYTPFDVGPPDFTPRLRPIAVEDWLPPWRETGWLEEKRRLMRDRRGEVWASTGEGVEAAREAADLVLAVAGAGALGEWPTPLEAAAASVPDDLCVMRRDQGGAWRLEEASVCAPTYWRLGDVIGQPLGAIHGPVPGGDPLLAARIARVFDGLAPGTVLERFNWTVQAGAARFTPDDAPILAEAEAATDWRYALYLRVERQTIRKLARSGAVLFTIRVENDPLAQVIDDPELRIRFAAAWRSASASARAYKSWAVYDGLIEAALRETTQGEGRE
ncbi:MAG: DUF3445 domain-containing protein [Pseudomonadota bacterium]